MIRPLVSLSLRLAVGRSYILFPRPDVAEAIVPSALVF